MVRINKTPSTAARIEGSIHKRDDGLWVAMLGLGRGPNGKRKRKALYGKMRREAADKLQAALSKLQQGTLVDPGRLTVGEYLQRWLDSIKPSIELRTWVGYESKLRIHVVPTLGSLRLAKLTPLHLQDLYVERLAAGKSPQTVLHIHRVFYTALAQAVKWQVLALNPAAPVESPKVEEKERPFLNLDQSRVFLAALDRERLAPLHMTAVVTGLREGEILALRWSDINLDTGDVMVFQTVWWPKGDPRFKTRPKSDRPRRVAVPGSVLPILRRHRVQQAEERLAAGSTWHDRNLVFAAETGQPVRIQRLLRDLKRIPRTAGLPDITFHDLRHSAASLLIALGTPLKEVSEILGHSTIGITADLYGHLLPGAQQNAANRLNDALFDSPQSDPQSPPKRRPQA